MSIVFESSCYAGSYMDAYTPPFLSTTQCGIDPFWPLLAPGLIHEDLLVCQKAMQAFIPGITSLESWFTERRYRVIFSFFSNLNREWGRQGLHYAMEVVSITSSLTDDDFDVLDPLMLLCWSIVSKVLSREEDQLT
ncbi:hypothetical protein D9758_016023 [Tetrapyrgos nigripes]|uniref:Uncharacterized protein n=1 Tax=Tetrapyrgos nigripes TaxID=182062 RepID=A0A8H5CLM8_9AGAR|nr:hypothetical protein D9758_016023 [Tetrapyrgos nigripes]